MDAVIETSHLTNYVGDDVMGVMLDKQTNTVSSHFRRADPQRQAQLLQQVARDNEIFQGQPQFQQMASVSTPYVLTPGMIFAPSIGNPGGWTVNRGISFNFTGFDDPEPKPGGAYFAGQPRKQQP
jgi:hypothetical protein